MKNSKVENALWAPYAKILQDRAGAKTTAEGDIKLFTRYKAGDKHALNELIKNCLHVVVHYACKYRRNADFEDLMSYGNLGIMLALNKYDPKHKVRFNTYADQWIQAYIVLAVKRHGSVVSRPASKPYSNDDHSLNAPIADSSPILGTEADVTFQDLLLDESVPVDKKLEAHDDASFVRHVLSLLPDRTQNILRDHDMIDDPLSFNELGAGGNKYVKLTQRGRKKVSREMARKSYYAAANQFRVVYKTEKSKFEYEIA